MSLAHDIRDLLNDLLETDPIAISEWMEARVDVNQSLADHPHVTVLSDDGGGDVCRMGAIGIFNGLVRRLEGPDAPQVLGHFNMSNLRTVTRFSTTDEDGTVWAPGMKKPKEADDVDTVSDRKAGD